MMWQKSHTHKQIVSPSLSNGFLVCATEFVFCLDASDAFLKDRVMNLPERLVQEHNYEQEHFLLRLARYRENNLEDKNVVNYFDELDVTLLYLGNLWNMTTACVWVVWGRVCWSNCMFSVQHKLCFLLFM